MPRRAGQLFPVPESHGDYIGTSGPIHFHQFTVTVEHQNDFALRKMFAAVGGVEIPMYQQDENGSMVSISVFDQIEREINEDVANEWLTALFNAVLNAS